MSSSAAPAPPAWGPAAPTSGACFCPRCHSMMDLPDLHNTMHCAFCTFEQTTAAVKSSQETKSKSSRESNTTQEAINMDPNASRAVVKEKCPKCNHGKMYFYTMQLRSADEGQTVFYECIKCKHKYNLNT